MIFTRDLMELVINGKKTQTRRLHKHILKENNEYPLKWNWYDQTGRKIKIIKCHPEKLGAITLEDAKKEGFNSVEEFIEKWIKINKRWDPETIVIVYDFQLVE